MLRPLAIALTLTTAAHAAPPEWPLATFEDVQAEWVRVSRTLPLKPSKCADLARWACAAQAVAARSRGEEPDMPGCFTLIDDAKGMDRTPAKRRECARTFRVAVDKTRHFEATMHDAAVANGALPKKPDARRRSVVRSVPFMALLASVFRGRDG